MSWLIAIGLVLAYAVFSSRSLPAEEHAEIRARVDRFAKHLRPVVIGLWRFIAWALIDGSMRSG